MHTKLSHLMAAFSIQSDSSSMCYDRYSRDDVDSTPSREY